MPWISLLFILHHRLSVSRVWTAPSRRSFCPPVMAQGASSDFTAGVWTGFIVSASVWLQLKSRVEVCWCPLFAYYFALWLSLLLFIKFFSFLLCSHIIWRILAFLPNSSSRIALYFLTKFRRCGIERGPFWPIRMLLLMCLLCRGLFCTSHSAS
jgi:hypothetical protein